jgi:hypothetical protein
MVPASREDWFDIHTLFVRYACALDACETDALVDCFEPDGSLDSPVRGKFSGHAEIRAFAQINVTLKAQGVQYRHVVSNLRAEVAGDRGHAKCYLVAFLTRGGETEPLSPAEYDCDLKKSAGVWRFLRRDLVMDQVSSPPNHLAANP